MAKFGVFAIRGGARPLQSFEGDYMTQVNQFVYIFKMRGAARSDNDDQVAAINLEPGFSVKKIGD